MNNLPSGQDGWERHAPKPARSTVAIPSRVICRRPAGSRASVRRSERTSSREDPCISLTSDRRVALTPRPSTGKRKMKAWKEITYYGGFDWARDHHDVVIVDRSGPDRGRLCHRAHCRRLAALARASGRAGGGELSGVCGDQPRHGRRAIAGKRGDCLSDCPGEQQSLPGAQSAQWDQDRSAGCLEFGRCPAPRWPRLESSGQRGSARLPSCGCFAATKSP